RRPRRVGAALSFRAGGAGPSAPRVRLSSCRGVDLRRRRDGGGRVARVGGAQPRGLRVRRQRDDRRGEGGVDGAGTRSQERPMGEVLVTGGELVARTLKEASVGHAFTLCGGHVLPIYDGCVTEGIRVIDVRHEQVAAHAADAYARLTRNVGVAIVTAGPGVTDAVTGVANAHAPT